MTDIITERVVEAWRGFVAAHVAAGWAPDLLTFMFDEIDGGRDHRLREMSRLIECAYKTFVTRADRKPRSLTREGRLPIWLCAPDLPVWKREKKADLSDLLVNDGLHVHAISLNPPWSRVEGIKAHFANHHSRYCEVAELRRLHVRPITSFDRDPVGYALKHVLRSSFEVGDIFALPRPLSELPARRVWVPPQARPSGERGRPRLNAVRR